MSRAPGPARRGHLPSFWPPADVRRRAATATIVGGVRYGPYRSRTESDDDVDSSEAEESLFSTVHGAGRVMSRTEAAGKVRRRKRWACAHPGYDRVFEIDGISSTNRAGARAESAYAGAPDSRLMKVWIEEQAQSPVRSLAGRPSTTA